MAWGSQRRLMELHRAWRNVRARGWRGLLTAGLLALAMGASALVFSVTDSLVFHRIPYRDPQQLVEIQRTGSPSALVSAPLLEEWRKQTELFGGVHGFLTKTLFLSGHGEPEIVETADVTVGLIELLGTRPRWGRSLAAGDDRQLDLQPVLVAESFAHARFGSPAAAIGRQLATTAEPLLVVGVMPGHFRFPDNTCRIWRALDPRGPLTRGFGAVSSIARITPGVSREIVGRMVEQRSVAVGAAAGASGYSARLRPWRGRLADAEQRRLLAVLLGAAACLLLIACVNVASLELAHAHQRARTHAIQLAVGASRAALARVAAIEGALLVGGATVAAMVMAMAGARLVDSVLPAALTRSSTNPIDLDARSVLYMAGIAAAAWLVSSVPVMSYAWRANLADLLKLETASVAASARGTLVRRGLTVLEVALAVMLLVGSGLYVRSYLALMALQKGFDTTGVLAMSLSIPPQAYASLAEKRSLAREAVERLRARPGVVAVTDASAPPDTGAVYKVTQLEIDGRAPIHEDLSIAELDVRSEYFSILRIPLRAGRPFDPVEAPAHVIVSETFARRYWPNGNAVGGRYRFDAARPWRHVIGVAGHVRSRRDPPGMSSVTSFQTYIPRQPPPPAASPSQADRARGSGGSYGFITLMARVDSRSRAGDLYQTVRAIDTRFILKLEFVDDAYAQHFDDRLLAARVITGFGVLSFVIAAAGIYGVMAFLIAQRTREIGIRMALGADRARIKTLVLGSALRLSAIGTALGIAGAVGAARWAQSQLFGITATDPGTIGMVAVGVLATTLLATWQPAQQATRVDPNVLLKS